MLRAKGEKSSTISKPLGMVATYSSIGQLGLPHPMLRRGCGSYPPPPALGRSKGAGGVPLLLAKHGGRMRIPKGCAHPWCEAWMRFGAGLIKFRIKGILKQDKVYTIAIAHPSPKG